MKAAAVFVLACFALALADPIPIGWSRRDADDSMTNSDDAKVPAGNAEKGLFSDLVKPVVDKGVDTVNKITSLLAGDKKPEEVVTNTAEQVAKPAAKGIFSAIASATNSLTNKIPTLSSGVSKIPLGPLGSLTGGAELGNIGMGTGLGCVPSAGSGGEAEAGVGAEAGAGAGAGAEAGAGAGAEAGAGAGAGARALDCHVSIAGVGLGASIGKER